MQDAVETAFGALEVVERGDGRKRYWRLESRPVAPLVRFSTQEGTDLAWAAGAIRRNGLLFRAEPLDALVDKLTGPVAPPFRDRALRARMRAATRGGENAGPETQAYRIDRARAQRAVAPPASAPRRPVVKGGPHGA